MAYFLDTSALVKIYVREPGSEYMLRIAKGAAPGEMVISRLAEVELAAALRTMERTGRIGRKVAATIFAAFLDPQQWWFAHQSVSDAVLGLAVRLVEQHSLRAYDAVQLASCLTYSVHTPATFLCSDRQLLVAAAAAGVPCADPETSASG